MRVMLHNKQKPYYCMERHYVNTEATSIESGLSYRGRSVSNPSAACESVKEETTAKADKPMAVWCRQKSAEVVVLGRYEPRGERGGLTPAGRTEC